MILDQLWQRGPEFLGVRYPIICGAMTWISDSELVAAVSRAGAFGSLAAGKRADILVIRPDAPTPITPASAISYFTMTFRGREVETVLVDGQVVVDQGRMTTVDEEEVERKCLEEAKNLWRKNGIDV